MPTAKASHILVTDENTARDLKQKIDSGESDFTEAAKAHSKCPSGREGGSLGEFAKGRMVPEFDRVVFGGDLEVGQVSEPVKTQFGYHLIQVHERSDG